MIMETKKMLDVMANFVDYKRVF